MASIANVTARQILDSRGIPTVECTVWLDTGHFVTSSAPAGTSKGKYEAQELRDGDSSQYQGKGVLKAVANIEQSIAPALIGQDPANQQAIDEIIINLDSSQNKSKLGANATIAVSQAVLKAGALMSGWPLFNYVAYLIANQEPLFIPTNIYTVINGGSHGAGNLDMQEYQFIPATYYDFPTSLNMAASVFNQLGALLQQKGAIHSVGIVGGFAPNLYANTDGFEVMIEAGKMTNYTFGQDFFFGLDVAASSFFSNSKYTLRDKTQPYSTTELFEYYFEMKNRYRLMLIEDPFQEDDHAGWERITKDLGETTTIVGDSYLVTSRQKLAEAVKRQACNAILIKPNQVGTITETLWVIQEARQAGFQVVVSHRSGETNDDLIADLAVGVGAEYVKFGPPNRGERVAKLNRLMAINTQLAATNTTNQTAS